MKLYELIKGVRGCYEISIERDAWTPAPELAVGYTFKNVFDGTISELRKHGRDILHADIIYYDYDTDENRKYFVIVNCYGVPFYVSGDRYKKIADAVDAIGRLKNEPIEVCDKAWERLDSLLPTGCRSHFEYCQLYFTTDFYGCQSYILPEYAPHMPLSHFLKGTNHGAEIEAGDYYGDPLFRGTYGDLLKSDFYKRNYNTAVRSYDVLDYDDGSILIGMNLNIGAVFTPDGEL